MINYIDWKVVITTLLSAGIIALGRFVIKCLFRKPNVKVSFGGSDSLTIYPEYVQTIRKEQKIQSGGYVFGSYNDWKYRDTTPPIVNTERDSRLCEVCLDVENIGDITLKDYFLRVQFEKEKVKELKTNLVKDSAWDADIDEDSSSIELTPNYSLTKGITKKFSFDLMPSDGVKDIKLTWTFVSDHFEKSGELTIHVKPSKVVRYVS